MQKAVKVGTMGKIAPNFEAMSRAELIATCYEFWEIIQKLESRVEELERRLNQNSRNSSKPPSSDYTSHRQPRLKKKLGPPKGHPGTTRTDFDRVDKTQELLPETCECGASLACVEGHLKHTQQVAELIQPVEITEYRCYSKLCPECGSESVAPWPETILPGKTLGPKLQAWLSYLHVHHNQSYQKLETFCRGCLRLPISPGTLSRVFTGVNGALAPGVDQLQTRVQQESANHLDETSWRLAGKKHWLWSAVSEDYSYFWIHSRRSREAFEAGMGSHYTGACHGDFYGMYTSYDGQGCWSHLFRDIQACQESPLIEEQTFGEILMARLDAIWQTWRDWKTGQMPWFLVECMAGFMQGQLLEWLNQLPPSLPKRANRLKKRMLKQWERIFYFLDHPGTPPDNNIAERALRSGVINRKVTGGNRQSWGTQLKSRLFSVVDTCRKQNTSAIDFIQNALLATAHPHLTYPTLIPNTS